MISLTHVLEYIIEFKNPVDLFDVIYQLKIITRNDFIGNSKKIIICRLSPYKKYQTIDDDPINRFAISKFIASHANKWNNSSDRVIFTGFERTFNLHKEEFKQDYQELNDNLDKFEEHYNEIIELSNEFEKTCDKLELTKEEFKLIDSINKFPGLKDNISFMGWRDTWIVE